MVRYLIAAGAKVELKSDDGMTALHLATQNGHLECAHIILGSNNLPKNHINVKDDGGWTPLVWACEHKHEAVIRFLLEQGCDPFATDVEMNVALHWAAFSGEYKCVCLKWFLNLFILFKDQKLLLSFYLHLVAMLTKQMQLEKHLCI